MSNPLPEGSRVSYVGDGSDGLVLGDRGELLSRTGAAGHVMWSDGHVTLTDLDFLAPAGRQQRTAVRDELADSLDVGPIQAVGLRAVYDSEGGCGVLSALESTGVLSSFPAIAEEVLSFAAQGVRQDGAVRRALGSLDDEAAEELIALATSTLLRDALGGQVDE